MPSKRISPFVGRRRPEIARSVEEINAVTKESAQGADQAAKAATMLSQQGERLQALVGKFKL